jgi:hypothetical protein
MYNNPLTITSCQYRFISDLLLTRKLLKLLPSSVMGQSCFLLESRFGSITESSWNLGHTAIVTEGATKAWRDSISNEMKQKRRSLLQSHRETQLHR